MTQVAVRKVCVVQEVILAEAQRVERVAAEKAHAAKMLQGARSGIARPYILLTVRPSLYRCGA